MFLIINESGVETTYLLKNIWRIKRTDLALKIYFEGDVEEFNFENPEQSQGLYHKLTTAIRNNTDIMLFKEKVKED